MMGNLRCVLLVANSFAKGSSRYPTLTALIREMLASVSVPWTIVSFRALAAAGSSPPSSAPLPTPRKPPLLTRPGPLAREVRRLGICGA